MLSYFLSVLEYNKHQPEYQADFPHQSDFALNTGKYAQMMAGKE